MAENNLVKISFEVDGIDKSVSSVEELQDALKDVQDQATQTAGEIKQIGEEIDGTGKAASGALGILNKATGGLSGQLVKTYKQVKDLGSGLASSFRAGVLGASALGKALAATGIGAVVVLLGVLAAGFMKSRKEADEHTEALKKQKDAQEALKASIERTAKAREIEIERMRLEGANAAKLASERLKDVNAQIDEQQKIIEKEKQRIDELNKANEELYGTAIALSFSYTSQVIDDANFRITELQNEVLAQQNIINDFNSNQQKRRIALDQELANTLENLQAKNIEDAEEQALQLLEIQRKRQREELVLKRASDELLLEFELNFQKQREDIEESFRLQRKAKEDKETEDLLNNRKIIDLALQQARLLNIEDVFKRAQEELDIQEALQIEQLKQAGATQEELDRITQSFSDKRKKIAKDEADFKQALDQQVQAANLDVASAAFGTLSEIIGDNSSLGKAAAIASTTVDTYAGAQRAYISQLIPGDPSSPVRASIAAGVAIAAGLANVAKIIATPLPIGPEPAAVVPTAPIIPQFNPQAALADRIGQDVPPAPVTTQQVGSGSQVVRAYVVDSEITSAQAATRKIQNLASL